MNTLNTIQLVLALLGPLYLAILWFRKPRPNDIRATLGIKRTPGSMAVPLNAHLDGIWDQYEAPTCMRRGMSTLATGPAKPEQAKPKTRKSRKTVTKAILVAQDAQATDARFDAPFPTGFEVIA